MHQTSGENPREQLQLSHFPCFHTHLSAFTTQQHFPFSKFCSYLHNCTNVIWSVPLLSFSAAGSLFHKSTPIPREHICTVTQPLWPLLWHSPSCQVFHMSWGNPVPTSLSVPLLSCLSRPSRCNTWPILTAWIIQRVRTIRELQRFNKSKLWFPPWVSSSRGKREKTNHRVLGT